MVTPRVVRIGTQPSAALTNGLVASALLAAGIRLWVHPSCWPSSYLQSVPTLAPVATPAGSAVDGGAVAGAARYAQPARATTKRAAAHHHSYASYYFFPQQQPVTQADLDRLYVGVRFRLAQRFAKVTTVVK